MTFNVFEAPNTNVVFNTNSHKLLVFWNFCHMGDCLSMEKEPCVYGFYVIHFQKKNHAFGSAQDKEPVGFSRSFLLPFCDYFGLFTVNLNVKLRWNSFAERNTCDLLVEVSAQAVFYLVLMQQVFENCRVWLIDSVDTNSTALKHNENSIDVTAVVQKYNLLCTWWWKNCWNYGWVLPIWVLKLHRVIRKKCHYCIGHI